MTKAIQNKPFLQVKHRQVLTSLKHLNLATSSIDPNYPHAHAQPPPYPFEPTINTIKEAIGFLSALTAKESPQLSINLTPGELQDQIKVLRDNESAFVKKVVANPLEHYQNFKKRLREEGINSKFPEFANTVDCLKLTLFKEGISEFADEDPAFNTFRNKVYEELESIKESGYSYIKVIDGIESALRFLDVYERGKDAKATPELFHSFKYEYYSTFLKDQIPEHFIFPSLASVGATDLLKVRGVPIGFIGVNTVPAWVDAFSQTPLEFWYHDVNHSRRMFQFFKEEAQEQGLSIDQFAAKSNQFVREQMIPIISIKKADDVELSNQKRMIKMILFEILHEDALAADPEVIRTALLRAPNTRTPNEVIRGNSISYNMEKGATTVAFVYRKLAGDFYDMQAMRMNTIVAADKRSQSHVTQGALALANQLQLEDISPDMVREYTVNDEGFPKEFLDDIIDFMRKNPGAMAPLSIDVNKGS